MKQELMFVDEVELSAIMANIEASSSGAWSMDV